MNTLPEEVVQCLEKARYLHLATSYQDFPHVSLMSYTYLPSTPYSDVPSIIMTTTPSSQKTSNLENNPNVSILVHEWISERPPTLQQQELSSSPDGIMGRQSTLSSILTSMNSAALGRISVSINGTARILESNSEQATWYKAKHKESNRFESEDAGCYIDGEEVQVVIVQVKDGRISDFQGATKDFVMKNTSINGI